MLGAIPPLPNMPSWHGAQLKHRDNFNLTLCTACILSKIEILYGKILTSLNNVDLKERCLVVYVMSLRSKTLNVRKFQRPRRMCSICCMRIFLKRPASVAERSKASTVFGRSNIGIAGSNPTQGMDVCLSFSVLCCPV
jgi:hypothetical protein